MQELLKLHKRQLGLLVILNLFLFQLAMLSGLLAANDDLSRVELVTLDNKQVRLVDSNYRGTIVVFISTDCPIANSYQPLLNRLATDWQAQQLQLVMVHGNPETSREHAELHAKEFGICWPIAIDPQQRIAKILKAKNIPEAFLVNNQGKVEYRGRIDDQYSALGRKRPEPTESNLQNAVNALIQGKAVEAKETKAIGCVIRYIDVN